MRSLLWKEWHEHSWKLAFSSLTLAAMAWIGLHARLIPDESMIGWLCGIGVAILPILSSAGMIAAERDEGGFESLRALPTPMRKILIAKIVVGLILCIGPMAAALAISLLIAGGREMTDGNMIFIYLNFTLATAAIFFWMLALTARLPTEARAALLNLGILVFWCIATGGLRALPLPDLAEGVSPFSLITGPFGSLGRFPSLMQLLTQIVLVAVLCIWTDWQLRKPLEG